MSEPTVTVTQYSVNAHPDPEAIDADLFEVTVDYCGNGKWAVRRGKRCYNRHADWEYEPIPSDRTKPWLKRFRFDTAEHAIDIAKRVTANLVINGTTARQAVR